MRLALNQAKKAYLLDEVPVGAVLVSREGKILSRAYNQTEQKGSPVKHAEVIVIEKAAEKMQDWRLEGCVLYVTLEPCMMCIGLIGLSRIERLIYGTESLLFGFVNGIMSTHVPDIYQTHLKEITRGVLKDEAAILLKNFFKDKRKKGEQFRGG